MKVKYLFPLFLIALLLFSFGCTNNTTTKETSTTPSSTVGVIYYEYNINGKQLNEVRLLEGEQAQINIKLKNVGEYPLKNISLKFVSCLNPVVSNNNLQKLSPGSTSYLSFTIYNNLSLQSQEITCPSIVRVYFNYVTHSYDDIAFVGKDYTGPQPNTIQYTDSELLSVSYDLPKVVRLINKDANVSGRIIIKNIGNGIVDYPTIGFSNEVKEISISVPNGIKIYEIGGMDVNKVAKIVEKDNRTIYNIISTDLNENQRELLTKLAVGGNNPGVAYIPIKLGLVNSVPNDGSKIYRIYVTVYYGYSYDLFKFNLRLVGS